MSTFFNSVPVINDDDIEFHEFDEDYDFVEEDPLNVAFYDVEDMTKKFSSLQGLDIEIIKEPTAERINKTSSMENVINELLVKFLNKTSAEINIEKSKDYDLNTAFLEKEDFLEKFGMDFDLAIGVPSPTSTTANLSPGNSSTDLVANN